MVKQRITALVLVFTLAAVGFFVFMSEKNEDSSFHFKFGLDLRGGTQLVYQADVSDLEEGEIEDAMATLRDVIERRVNLFGVSEPLVQTETSRIAGVDHRLIVELPGVTDIDEAVRLIGETPLLEFKLLTAEIPESEEQISPEEFDEFFTATGLTGRFVQKAQLQFADPYAPPSGSGNTSVLLTFNAEGARLFEDITTNNVGEILGIFLDGSLISAPVLQEPIPGGEAVITGNFTPEEARELVRSLNFGALPLPIELVGTQSVGASLGEVVLNQGVKAFIWGLVLVSLFLILWYRLPGLLSVFALAGYVIIMLALFKLIPVTLTAAGIAGFILSVGMAVDANVLIFERLKEEIRNGKAAGEAVKEGFSRAWPSIRDANISSLITAVILFWFGTSVVQGFALVFGLGILVSMITAITVTRIFLLAVASGVEGKSGFLFNSGIKKDISN